MFLWQVQAASRLHHHGALMRSPPGGQCCAPHLQEERALKMLPSSPELPWAVEALFFIPWQNSVLSNFLILFMLNIEKKPLELCFQNKVLQLSLNS